MLACESDSVETIEALLRGGADTQLVDHLGHRAADYAKATGNQSIVRILQDGVPPGTVQGLVFDFILGVFQSTLIAFIEMLHETSSEAN